MIYFKVKRNSSLKFQWSSQKFMRSLNAQHPFDQKIVSEKLCPIDGKLKLDETKSCSNWHNGIPSEKVTK